MCILDAREILPTCASFDCVKLEDLLCAPAYSCEDSDEMIGAKVLFTQEEKESAVQNPELWSWKVIAGIRDKNFLLCSPKERTLLVPIDDKLPRRLRIVSDSLRKSAGRMIRGMEMSTIEDVKSFENKHGEMSHELFCSREGFNLYEKARKIIASEEDAESGES